MLPIAAISLVFIMLVPLPAFMLDLLLAASITSSVLVFLSAIQIERPVQFSVFPTLLLLLTLFRLSLNLASSRLILLHGNEGANAAGGVIAAFGQFVVGGNYVVGFVLFLALIAIQFLVVSHGAVRTAEVTARFTLDALPGKQMAIDADLNAGLIDEVQAKERRAAVAHEAEFYGAMDGAARFNQRDAMATILITGINIIAGFLIGVLQLGMPLLEALKTYTILTVGDGLVTMVPSLLVSVAGGIVLTRASSEASLGMEMATQLLNGTRTLVIATGIMVVLAVVPGMPKLPFLLAAAGAGTLAWKRSQEQKAAAAESADIKANRSKALEQQPIETLMKLDPISLEVGYGLVSLVDETRGGQLLSRVRAVRRHLAQQLGFVLPPLQITDNLQLRPNEYVVYIRGVEVARYEMASECLLAISQDSQPAQLAGRDTQEPAFGTSAKWIASALQEQALASGYTVVDQTSALATHLSELFRQNAHELLTRAETKRLLDATGEEQPKLVEELQPKLMTMGEIQRVLQQLLREQVSLRDLPCILEALIEIAPNTKNPVFLVEAARQALARAVVNPLLAEDGRLRVLALSPTTEEEIVRATDGKSGAVEWQPQFVSKIIQGLKSALGDHMQSSGAVLLCPSPARFQLKRLLEPFVPRLAVLSPLEIPPAVRVETLHTVI